MSSLGLRALARPSADARLDKAQRRKEVVSEKLDSGVDVGREIWPRSC
jgi:hypothetical protein